METLSMVGKRIKIARIEADISQERLAEELEVSQKTVSAWEAGRNEIGASNIQRMAMILGKPVDYFFQPFQKQHPNAVGARRKAA